MAGAAMAVHSLRMAGTRRLRLHAIDGCPRD